MRWENRILTAVLRAGRAFQITALFLYSTDFWLDLSKRLEAKVNLYYQLKCRAMLGQKNKF
jgi:hypothetical protein